MISGREALERLRQGDQRFVSGVRSSDMLASHFWPRLKSSCGRRRANRKICARSSTASDHPWKSVSSNHLRHASDVLEQLIERDRLLVVGAEYSLETGVVDFFDGVRVGM